MANKLSNIYDNIYNTELRSILNRLGLYSGIFLFIIISTAYTQNRETAVNAEVHIKSPNGKTIKSKTDDGGNFKFDMIDFNSDSCVIIIKIGKTIYSDGESNILNFSQLKTSDNTHKISYRGMKPPQIIDTLNKDLALHRPFKSSITVCSKGSLDCDEFSDRCIINISSNGASLSGTVFVVITGKSTPTKRAPKSKRN